jgi:hypothetical protein
MAATVKVTVVTHGAEKLDRLGRAIKDAGDKDMRRELPRAAQRCGKPMKAAAREGALKRLPKRGGLAERVATSKLSVRTRTVGKGAGVRIVGQSGYDLQGMDDGQVRHPVFGNRKRWVSETVKPGWFSDAEEAAAPQFRDEFERAMDAVAAKLEASA